MVLFQTFCHTRIIEMGVTEFCISTKKCKERDSKLPSTVFTRAHLGHELRAQEAPTH